MNDDVDAREEEPVEADGSSLRGTAWFLTIFGVLIIASWAGAYALLISRS